MQEQDGFHACYYGQVVDRNVEQSCWRGWIMGSAPETPPSGSLAGALPEPYH